LQRSVVKYDRATEVLTFHVDETAHPKSDGSQSMNSLDQNPFTEIDDVVSFSVNSITAIQLHAPDPPWTTLPYLMIFSKAIQIDESSTYFDGTKKQESSQQRFYNISFSTVADANNFTNAVKGAVPSLKVLAPKNEQ
jgi:hypothetical protein